MLPAFLGKKYRGLSQSDLFSHEGWIYKDGVASVENSPWQRSVSWGNHTEEQVCIHRASSVQLLTLLN